MAMPWPIGFVPKPCDLLIACTNFYYATTTHKNAIQVIIRVFKFVIIRHIEDVEFLFREQFRQPLRFIHVLGVMMLGVKEVAQLPDC